MLNRERSEERRPLRAAEERQRAADAAARQEAQRRADVQAAAKEEANIAAIKSAMTEAGSVVDSFLEEDANPDVPSPTVTRMREVKRKAAANINNQDAKAEFREIVENGIQEIVVSRREAKAVAEKAKAAGKAAPTKATPKQADATPPAPEAAPTEESIPVVDPRTETAEPGSTITS